MYPFNGIYLLHDATRCNGAAVRLTKLKLGFYEQSISIWQITWTLFQIRSSGKYEKYIETAAVV